MKPGWFIIIKEGVGRNGFELGLAPPHVVDVNDVERETRVFQRIKYLGLDGSSSAGDVERWAKV